MVGDRVFPDVRSIELLLLFSINYIRIYGQSICGVIEKLCSDSERTNLRVYIYDAVYNKQTIRFIHAVYRGFTINKPVHLLQHPNQEPGAKSITDHGDICEVPANTGLHSCFVTI